MRNNSMVVSFSSAGARLALNAGFATDWLRDIEHVTFPFSSSVSLSVKWGNNSVYFIRILSPYVSYNRCSAKGSA